MVEPLTKINIQSGLSVPFERSKRLNSGTSIQISLDELPFTLAAEPFFCLLDLAYSRNTLHIKWSQISVEHVLHVFGVQFLTQAYNGGQNS